MQTPWGDLQVSDAHVHFFSHGFFSTLATQMPATQRGELKPAQAKEEIGRILGWTMPPADPAALADIWGAELDRHGVSRSCMIASIPGDEASVAAAVARHADRFHGYFMLNPLAPDSLARVEKALQQDGLQGICLFPAMHRYSMDDERLGPILQYASTIARAVVFVHCGVLTVGVRGKLGLPSPFDMRYSNPIDLHPIALLYPKLNFVIPHFGAGYFREALMLCDLCPNVYLDTSSSNSWMKYQAPEVNLAMVFRRALDVLGPNRLLFGTDSSFFPRGWNIEVFAEQVAALQSLGVSKEVAIRIFGGNLESLLCNG
jgi:predicted TIM-barrel fold metal-dependent hydrolase